MKTFEVKYRIDGLKFNSFVRAVSKQEAQEQFQTASAKFGGGRRIYSVNSIKKGLLPTA